MLSPRIGVVNVLSGAVDMSEQKMTRISATVPSDLMEEFKRYCAKQHRSVSAQIAYLIEQTLQEAETESSNV